MLFPFFARSIAGKLKSPLCNDERRRRDGKISIFTRYIHQNSRHVANLDASASTSSISNNTREKNDIAVHRFFSLSPFSLSQSFHFQNVDPRWSNISLPVWNTVFGTTSSTPIPVHPVILLRWNTRNTPPPVEKGDSLYTSRMQISVRMERARAIFHASLFSTSFHPVLSIRFLLFVEKAAWECWIIDPRPDRRSIVADSCR